MPSSNTQCKFKYQERVKIVSGFYRDHVGIIQTVDSYTHWFRTKYVYEVSCTGIYTTVRVKEDNLLSIDFNDKLQKVLSDDNNKDRPKEV